MPAGRRWSGSPARPRGGPRRARRARPRTRSFASRRCRRRRASCRRSRAPRRSVHASCRFICCKACQGSRRRASRGKSCRSHPTPRSLLAVRDNGLTRLPAGTPADVRAPVPYRRAIGCASMPATVTREDIVTAEAHAAGFPLAGTARLEALPVGDFLRDWLATGRAGEMHYLGKRAAVRIDPRVQFRWARSLVCVGLPYRPPPPPRDDWRVALRGRIAAYAAGPDYHEHVQARLDRLAAALAERFPGTRYLSYVDTGALLEREWGRRAGLGWIAKNTLVLHRHAGSYFFLGELVTDLELDAVPLPSDHCGSCMRCV